MSAAENVDLSRRMGKAWATKPIYELTDAQRAQMRKAASDGLTGFDALPTWAQDAIIAGEAWQNA